LETVLTCLSSTTRWDILRELADGGSLMVSEISRRTGWGPSVVSKQLAILRNAGIVINPRGRLFEITPQFVADKSQRLLDFGWCTLRMNAGAEK
jgi:predicted transcriptional regulator